MNLSKVEIQDYSFKYEISVHNNVSDSSSSSSGSPKNIEDPPFS